MDKFVLTRGDLVLMAAHKDDYRTRRLKDMDKYNRAIYLVVCRLLETEGM